MEEDEEDEDVHIMVGREQGTGRDWEPGTTFKARTDVLQ